MEFHNFIKFLLFFLSLILLNTFTKEYQCIADKFQKEPLKLKLNEDSISSDKFKSLKIKIDYTYLDYQNKNSDLKTFDSISLKQFKLSLEETVRYYQSILSINHKKLSGLTEEAIKKYCNIPKISNDYEDYLIDYDLVLFPYINYDLKEENLAVGNLCLIEEKNFRPIAGNIGINPNFVFTKDNAMIFLEKILFHEITHVLIFNPFTFKQKKLLFTEENDEKSYFINSTQVIKKAKLHYNCKEIKGIQLDDNKFHWKTNFMLGDYMIEKVYTEITISDITLALFEDSGWYKVNYFTGGLFKFGKNEGCNFLSFDSCLLLSNDTEKYEKREADSYPEAEGEIDKENPLFKNEYCNKVQRPFCSSGRTSRGSCSLLADSDEKNNKNEKVEYVKNCSVSSFLVPNINLYNDDSYLAESCRYGKRKNYIHYWEKTGENSICFESSLLPMISSMYNYLTSICYEVLCDKINKQVIINIKDDNITCPTNGGVVKNEYYVGHIYCPEYNMICSSKIWCNEIFDCIDKKSEADLTTYKAYRPK